MIFKQREIKTQKETCENALKQLAVDRENISACNANSDQDDSVIIVIVVKIDVLVVL